MISLLGIWKILSGLGWPLGATCTFLFKELQLAVNAVRHFLPELTGPTCWIVAAAKSWQENGGSLLFTTKSCQPFRPSFRSQFCNSQQWLRLFETSKMCGDMAPHFDIQLSVFPQSHGKPIPFRIKGVFIGYVPRPGCQWRAKVKIGTRLLNIQ